jgi:hypothetical protein
VDEPSQAPRQQSTVSGFRFIATIVVVLCALAYGLLSFTCLAFCDTGPFSVCLRNALAFCIVACFQVGTLVLSWIQFHKGKRRTWANLLMILSALPLAGVMIVFVN